MLHIPFLRLILAHQNLSILLVRNGGIGDWLTRFLFLLRRGILYFWVFLTPVVSAVFLYTYLGVLQCFVCYFWFYSIVDRHINFVGKHISSIDRICSYFVKNVEVVMLSVIVVVAGCRCRCWGTTNYSSILMRGRKIVSRAPGIEPGSRTFKNLER